MKATKEELAEAVKKIMSGDCDDDHTDQLFDFIDKNVPCPYSKISQAIYYSNGLTPEQMVDEMLNYKPIIPA